MTSTDGVVRDTRSLSKRGRVWKAYKQSFHLN